MLIENPDAFKAWLTSVLEPLCDADPEALAKYVYALVKKDKSVEALRDVMIEQLDVFLQKETKPFVELLFKTLEKQEYLTPATPIPNTNPPNPNVPVVSVKTEVNDISIPKDVKPIIPVSSLPDLTLETVNGTAPVKKERETEAHKKEREREPKKSDSEKDDKARSGGRTRHRSTSRNRSRSRSWDRVRRTRSRDRSREPRERRDRSRPWRNKSPPRRYERRRSRSISPVRNRSRSPRHTYRSRYRNRSPTRSPTRSRSRSLDKHTDKEKAKDSKELPSKDPLSGAGTPTQDSNHGDTDMRLTSSTQSIQSVVAANSDVIVPPHVAPATVFTNKRRCRDFDEKGYCMRGELCPYDHGIDPVVLEDTALSSVLTFGPNGQPPLDGHPAPPALLPPMIRPNAGHMIHQHHLTQRPPLHPVMPAEYNPSAPSMWNARPGFRGPMGPRAPGLFTTGAPIMGPQPNMSGPSGTHNHVQRELINVPVIDNSIPPDNVYPRTTDFINVQENNIKKKGFDFNRLGPRTKNPVNCSLELKKVPRGLNNITHLNNHFSKFGKIVNIQVCFEGDPEAALITFSSHAEANAAYRSTEAVLNNRFIKVFWHNNNNNGEGKQENIPPVQRSVKERLGQNISPLAPMNSNKVLNLVQPKVSMAEAENVTNDKVVNNLTKNNVYVPSSKKDPVSILESKAQANAAIKKGQEILAAKEQLKKKQEEKRKEAVKLTQDLIKRKQELLDKQITQQKILIGKLESGSVKGQQKDDLKKAIHTLHQSIEDIRKSLIAAVKQKSSSRITQAAKITHIRKSKEEAQKEILDAELDLITKQQQGADTSDLVKKVTELKKQAQSLGIPSSRRGHMTLRIPRGNKFARVQRHSFSHSSIDHRPTKLLVSGYESDEEFQVLAHFAKFGEVTNFLCDNFTPSVILNYKTRKEAELAMLKGKQFQDRTLSITWCTNTQLSNKLSTNRHQPRTVLLEEPDEDHLLNATLPDEEAALEGVEGVDLSEEALLQDDEEEEEENEEDRSWRR